MEIAMAVIIGAIVGVFVLAGAVLHAAMTRRED